MFDSNSTIRLHHCIYQYLIVKHFITSDNWSRSAIEPFTYLLFAYFALIYFLKHHLAVSTSYEMHHGLIKFRKRWYSD